MNMLNLGCGKRFHADWTNVDFVSTGQNVLAYNLTKGVPFPDNHFDVVYHSNVIEHFSKGDAVKFMRECYRVLKPSGTIRIAYPDLEGIVVSYLKNLAEIRTGKTQDQANYDWIMLELLDQSVRNRSGGEMLAYFMRDTVPNIDYVIGRCGTEAKLLHQYGRTLIRAQQNEAVQKPRLDRRGRLRDLLKKVLKKSTFSTSREAKIAKLLGDEYEVLQLGRFRLGGEIHQWMYDEVSIASLLRGTGYTNIVSRTAAESSIPNWKQYSLDTEPDGSVYKPDSRFVEATKS